MNRIAKMMNLAMNRIAKMMICRFELEQMFNSHELVFTVMRRRTRKTRNATCLI
jgi:hypothetical protein